MMNFVSWAGSHGRGRRVVVIGAMLCQAEVPTLLIVNLLREV
jgi:hypothetical protein